MCSQDGSGSGSRMGSGSRGSDPYKGPPITMELMEVHNKNMEMKMLASFKEAKRNCEIRLLKDGTKQGLAQTKKAGLAKEESQHKKNSSIKKPSASGSHPKTQQYQGNQGCGSEQATLEGWLDGSDPPACATAQPGRKQPESTNPGTRGNHRGSSFPGTAGIPRPIYWCSGGVYSYLAGNILN